MNSSCVHLEWLGRVDYRASAARQREKRDAVLAGKSGEVIWMCEHPSVITTGRRPVEELPSRQWLAAAGVDLVDTERGGLATYHGPGQLVTYLILDRRRLRLSIPKFVWLLEQAVIQWLVEQGVNARRREGCPGVWVDEEKICSLGLHFRKGVSMHGLALNLTVSLEPFEWFHPCGIASASTTSLERICGVAPRPEEAAKTLGAAIGEVLGLDVIDTIDCQG